MKDITIIIVGTILVILLIVYSVYLKNEERQDEYKNIENKYNLLMEELKKMNKQLKEMNNMLRILNR